MRVPEKISEKLRELPDAPGCYMMRDRRGRIIYVGKAVSLRKRVRSYFRASSLRNASPKLRSLVHSAADLDYMTVRNEAEAVLTEGRLIKDYRPRYNVSFRDDKRFLMLRGEANATLPRFKVCRIQRDDGAAYFGPYASSHAARATLDFIEKRFGLRKCSPTIPNRETYRHCLNDIIRYCSAPCIGKISRSDYRERFTEACAFLSGDRIQYLKELRELMTEAADKMDFERASALRDTLFSLQETVKQKARIAPTPQMRRDDAWKGVQELQRVLGLTRPPLTIEGFDISNISGTYAVAGMVCFERGLPNKNRYRRFRIKTVEGADDPRMMGEVIRRHLARLGKEGGKRPDLLIVDGGLTQLRAARRELAALGVEEVPVAGLAKRFEDIYWKDAGPPIHLSRRSPALKVLQRLRDEAHRFALTYHRRLRSKRIRESVLEEVPGVGAKRKQALLNRFGSVRRMAQATEEEIADVPGVGRQMAHAIKERISKA